MRAMLKKQDYIQEGRGRPKQDAQGEKIYQLSGLLSTSIRKKEKKEEEIGCFIIAT